LQRHLAFEQALTNIPLVVGNRVTLLKNATDTYKAMLAAIVLSHSFGDEMNQMFEADLANAKPIELDQWRHRPIQERFDETIAGIVEPLL
jgi:hypothetical protein